MDIRYQFPDVHWIWGGGISFVYEVHPRIVVKVPKSGQFEREQFNKELEIYRVFSQNPPCASIVHCFHFSYNGIFLEYMRDMSLSSRIQRNHVRDQQTMVVTKVEKLEPLSLRNEWMNDLAQAVAFLESLNLAHGDLRPENILLDRNLLKLSDFDCTAEIGTNYEACMAPYGRILGDNETDQGECGTFGLLGPRTEQFALGSLFYLINYGFEVYGDQCLTEDAYEHGPKVVELLQNKVFPKLDGNSLIDNIIEKCWHNRYVTVSELAAHTKSLLTEMVDARESHGAGTGEDTREERGDMVRNHVKQKPITPSSTVIGRLIWGLWAGLGDRQTFISKSTNSEVTIPDRANYNGGNDVNEIPLTEKYLWRKKFCQDLEERGLLHLLSLGEPEQIGFSFDWYRHSL